MLDYLKWESSFFTFYLLHSPYWLYPTTHPWVSAEREPERCYEFSRSLMKIPVTSLWLSSFSSILILQECESWFCPSLTEYGFLHLSVGNKIYLGQWGADARRDARKYLVIHEGPIPFLNHWAQNLRIWIFWGSCVIPMPPDSACLSPQISMESRRCSKSYAHSRFLIRFSALLLEKCEVS